MNELPEKLELLEDNPTWITCYLGSAFDVPYKPELALEIVRRYNGFAEQQKLIEQQPCQTCGGSGLCPDCRGTGKV
jgi:hypothetical protein